MDPPAVTWNPLLAHASYQEALGLGSRKVADDGADDPSITARSPGSASGSGAGAALVWAPGRAKRVAVAADTRDASCIKSYAKSSDVAKMIGAWGHCMQCIAAKRATAVQSGHNNDCC